MKVLVIGGTPEIPTQRDRDYYQDYIGFFTRSAKTKREDAAVYATMVDDLLIEVGDGEFHIYDTYNEADLSSYDVFFLRGNRIGRYMDVIATIQEYATVHGIKMINDYGNIRDSSKLLQATHFQRLDVPVAKTLEVNSALLGHLDRVKDWSFPCIMKEKHGSHGNDNYVVHSLEQVKDILQQTEGKRFVLQRFIPNDGDYRILLIGEETLIIARTAQEGSHLNNTSKGGAAEQVDVNSLPPEILEQARKIAGHFKMTIAGVDALQDKQTGAFYFLEVNAQPQLMSGALVGQKEKLIGKLLDSLVDKG